MKYTMGLEELTIASFGVDTEEEHLELTSVLIATHLQKLLSATVRGLVYECKTYGYRYRFC